MSAERTHVEQAALDWLVRVNDPAFAAWDEWEAWLARDPAHAETYWRLAEAEADIVAELAARAPARPVAASRASIRPIAPRRLWMAVAAAVAIVVLGGTWTAWLQRPQPWIVETAPGQVRSLTLADGTRLHLAGATRLSLDRAHPRRARLDQGRVLAEVVHDDRRPFVLTVDEATLTDLGTAFDVTRLQGGWRVAVSEGEVRVDADDQAVTLKPGEALSAHDGVMTPHDLPPADAGAWRTGRLIYRAERLEVVAQDLAIALGRPVAVAPTVADRRFTGSLSVTGAPEALRPRLELLLGVAVVEDADGWRLTPRAP